MLFIHIYIVTSALSASMKWMFSPAECGFRDSDVAICFWHFSFHNGPIRLLIRNNNSNRLTNVASKSLLFLTGQKIIDFFFLNNGYGEQQSSLIACHCLAHIVLYRLQNFGLPWCYGMICFAYALYCLKILYILSAIKVLSIDIAKFLL